jgi:hypothetical protein
MLDSVCGCGIIVVSQGDRASAPSKKVFQKSLKKCLTSPIGCGNIIVQGTPSFLRNGSRTFFRKPQKKSLTNN